MITRFDSCRFLLVGVLLATAACADGVTWSNGRVWEGQLALGEGALVKLHDGKRVRSWGLKEIEEITFASATQDMERAWVFKGAGKTAKEFSGDPYPIMELEASIQLHNGEAVHGHLLSTVFYLTASNRTEKLVIKYKLRGLERQTFADLVYATRICVGTNHLAVTGGGVVSVVVAGAGPQTELAMVSRARMQEAEVRRAGTNTFQVKLDGGDIVSAIRTGNRIVVGWHGEATSAARGRIEQGLRDLDDFFDERQLLGVSQDPADATTCHTLLLLSRGAKTTLDGQATQPWRLEIWKWRLGSETNDITVAARCVLFRGIRAPDAPLPEVVIGGAMGLVERLADGGG